MHPKSIASLRSGNWYEKYKDILLEKSINTTTKKASYTHPKIVSEEIMNWPSIFFIKSRYHFFDTYSHTSKCQTVVQTGSKDM